MEISKACLITGASRGLGEVLARRFWAAGYSLHLVARDEISLESLKDSLLSHEHSQICSIHKCDLSNLESIRELLGKVSASDFPLEVLINNAATHGPIGLLWENSIDEWIEAFRVDLFAPAILCHGVVPLMAAGGGGSIINLSGGGATAPRPRFTAYGTAKAAIVRFTETLAEETRALKIRVNCIAPGAMKTAMLREVLEKGAGLAGECEFSTASKVFDQGGASMDRVADLALFLASDKSSGITGKLISAVWDKWEDWPDHLGELNQTDVYTLRRVTGRDRGVTWGDR